VRQLLPAHSLPLQHLPEHPYEALLTAITDTIDRLSSKQLSDTRPEVIRDALLSSLLRVFQDHHCPTAPEAEIVVPAYWRSILGRAQRRMAQEFLAGLQQTLADDQLWLDEGLGRRDALEVAALIVERLITSGAVDLCARDESIADLAELLNRTIPILDGHALFHKLQNPPFSWNMPDPISPQVEAILDTAQARLYWEEDHADA